MTNYKAASFADWLETVMKSRKCSCHLQWDLILISRDLFWESHVWQRKCDSEKNATGK